MHEALVDLIRRTVNSLQDNLEFVYGRTSDFNNLNDQRFPSILLDPPTASGTFTNFQFSKTWNISMAFYALDREDSNETEYKKILDQTDVLVDKFIRKINQFYIDQAEEGEITTEQIVIQNVTQTAFIKSTSHILTGWLLNFQIVVPDLFDYCTLYE